MNQEIDKEIIEKHIKFYHVVIALSSSIAIILIYILGSSLLHFYFSKGNYQSVDPISIALSQIFLLLIPSILMVYLLKTPMNEFFPMKLPSLKFILLSTIGIIVLLAASEAFLQIQEFLLPAVWKKMYIEIAADYNKMVGQLLGKGNFLVVIQGIGILAVIPAISEEFLFRGYLQRSLMKGLKPITAIIVTASIFSISHLNIVNIIPLAIIGFYLGYVSYLSSSILTPIILHFINNAISVVSYFYNKSDKLEGVIHNNSELNIELIIFVTSISITIGLMVYLHKNYYLTTKTHPAEA